MSEAKANGKVYFIGAGPGDPGLLTVRGREILERADVIIYDYSTKALLRYANPSAEFFLVENKKINELAQLLIEQAREDKTLAYLVADDALISYKTGYPLNNVVTSALILEEAKSSFEFVPGVVNPLAGIAYAGFPVSDTTSEHNFVVISLPQKGDFDWQALTKLAATLIFVGDSSYFWGARNELTKAGKAETTPVCLIENPTSWNQKVKIGTLAEFINTGHQKAVLVVGDVVNLRQKLRWFDLPENRPLLGKRIVVTRAQAQAGTLAAKLTALGADAIEFATLRIAPPLDYALIDAAIAQLDSFDWVVFTSANGPEYFMARLKEANKDARAFGRAKICAIGPATAATLERYNLKADLIPEKYVAESILESFNRLGEIAGQRFLLARADVAREALADGLQMLGGDVTEIKIYRQVMPSDNEGPTNTSASEMVEMLEAHEIDAVLFTSSNTVRNFAKRLATLSDKPLPELLANTVVACIGPITSAAARDEFNLAVNIEASEFTIDGLIDALIDYFGKKRGE